MTKRRSALGILFTTASLVALTACSGGSGDSNDGETQLSGDSGGPAYSEEYLGSQDGSVDRPAPQGTVPSQAERGTEELPVPPEDMFVDEGVSGFVDAREDAESTFALDVDTGSFRVAQAHLADGASVPPDSIRVEEWINALTYDDPAPASGLAVRTETDRSPTGREDTQLVKVSVAAPEVDPAERPPANVTLVVDRSGSMDTEERLGRVQASLTVLADTLGPDDSVSVVSFEDTAVPILPPTPADRTDLILAAVEELTPGGSTNLEAGLALGYSYAEDMYDEDATNVVVLCSDGMANVGATLPEQIAEHGRRGINLVTVGFGMDGFNDHLMEQLANTGDGFYSYVDTADEAERLFGTDLTTMLTPMAKDARSQVSFDPELVEAYRLIGYENRAMADEDFEDMEVDAGELGSGHRATALYEVRVGDGVPAGATIGTAAVRWLDGDGETQRAQAEIRADDPETEPSRDLLRASTVADLALLLKGAEGTETSLADLADRAEAADDEELAEMIRRAV